MRTGVCWLWEAAAGLGWLAPWWEICGAGAGLRLSVCCQALKAPAGAFCCPRFALTPRLKEQNSGHLFSALPAFALLVLHWSCSDPSAYRAIVPLALLHRRILGLHMFPL